MKRKKIIVLGFMGGCPVAGVIWQHIHYIVGLQRLGHEVYYVEDTSNYPYNPLNADVSDDTSYAVHTLGRLASKYGFEGRWAYCARYKEPFAMAGMERDALFKLYREADCALNICGSHNLNEELASIRNLVYVESDPGVEQIKIDKGERDTIDYLRAHQHLFTFGENIGTAGFAVPLHGFSWLTTRQPVVIDFWCAPAETPVRMPEAVLTSVCNWSTAGQKDIVWRGSNYLWSKSASFLRFVEAPKRSGQPFELATDIASQSEREVFLENGWRLVRPHDLSVDCDRYRDYICNSKGEFTCAKDQYVRLKTGWFSDRTACYLAAGRPVLTEETGFTAHYGGKEGLLSFSTMEEIVEAVASICLDYERHSRAALAIGREVFEAEKVLESLLRRAGV
jgi:hypothetical protein